MNPSGSKWTIRATGYFPGLRDALWIALSPQPAHIYGPLIEYVSAEYCYLELWPWNGIRDDLQLGSQTRSSVSCSDRSCMFVIHWLLCILMSKVWIFYLSGSLSLSTLWEAFHMFSEHQSWAMSSGGFLQKREESVFLLLVLPKNKAPSFRLSGVCDAAASYVLCWANQRWLNSILALKQPFKKSIGGKMPKFSLKQPRDHKLGINVCDYLQVVQTKWESWRPEGNFWQCCSCCSLSLLVLKSTETCCPVFACFSLPVALMLLLSLLFMFCFFQES